MRLDPANEIINAAFRDDFKAARRQGEGEGGLSLFALFVAWRIIGKSPSSGFSARKSNMRENNSALFFITLRIILPLIRLRATLRRNFSLDNFGVQSGSREERFSERRKHARVVNK